MAQLLYIKASPRGNRSHALAAADAFLGAYQELHPEVDIVTLDLFTEDLPPFDGLRINAKYNILHGQPHPPEEAEAWQVVERYIKQFKAADKYLLATPMWNFSIPYRLKQYLDIIVQPTYTFSFSPEEGYRGLVIGKPIQVVYARGGQYPSGSPGEAFDLQTKYVDLIFRFMGFTDIRSLIVEPTLEAGPEVAKLKRAEAMAQAREMAKTF